MLGASPVAIATAAHPIVEELDGRDLSSGGRREPGGHQAVGDGPASGCGAPAYVFPTAPERVTSAGKVVAVTGCLPVHLWHARFVGGSNGWLSSAAGRVGGRCTGQGSAQHRHLGVVPR